MALEDNTMITFETKGDYKKTERFLEKLLNGVRLGSLDKYGRMGVEALRSATPVDTGLTADSWTYTIERTKDGTGVVWSNTNVQNGVNIAIILQYGHGTGGGGYVVGRDYINPALRPIFDEMANSAWKEVING